MDNKELKWLKYFTLGVSAVQISAGRKPYTFGVYEPNTSRNTVVGRLREKSLLGKGLGIHKKLDKEEIVTKENFLQQISLMLETEEQREKFLSREGVNLMVARDGVQYRVFAISKNSDEFAVIYTIPL